MSYSTAGKSLVCDEGRRLLAFQDGGRPLILVMNPIVVSNLVTIRQLVPNPTFDSNVCDNVHGNPSSRSGHIAVFRRNLTTLHPTLNPCVELGWF